jgi:hypothetical protein
MIKTTKVCESMVKLFSTMDVNMTSLEISA